MFSKVKISAAITANMGLHYALFRSVYELKRKTGYLKKEFPANNLIPVIISLKEWQQTRSPFFFESKESLNFPRCKSEILKYEAEKILNGEINYFSSSWVNLGNDWVTNPDNSFKHDIEKHWSEIADYSAEAGDIKYVWEKSRFGFLYSVIRYDYHFDRDCSEFVFNEILDWISKNPINMGPNYKCSQEISLRLLNWTFALFYYKNSKNLSEERFQIILNSIYNQVIHVRDNINFSRILVRNNHAITETLCLYLIGLLYPFFDIAPEIKAIGKKYFEEEIDFQISEDGTYLQYSMNYHRVVLQLLTWALYISTKNDETFFDVVYEKAYKSLRYLYLCQDSVSGELPNYGANDGALIFKLNNLDYRNYSAQLNALYYYFFKQPLYNDPEAAEDACWYGNKCSNKIFDFDDIKEKPILCSFNDGGYYIINENETFTFIRCGKHKSRPSQADNLHVDIWFKGKNILRDGGSYKYNTSDDEKKYFFGSSSHNTIMLEENDQMLKGPRFTWLNWTNAVDGCLNEDTDKYVFEGTIKAFTYINKNIRHRRKVTKYKNELCWIIEDWIVNKPDLTMRQIWNFSEDYKIAVHSKNRNNEDIDTQIKEAWYSGKYGQKESTQQIIFSTDQDYLRTEIRILE